MVEAAKTEQTLPELMTTRQVTEYLGISVKVLRGLRDKRFITPLPGNPLHAKEWQLRYRREDVEFLKQYGRTRRPENRDQQRKAS